MSEKAETILAIILTAFILIATIFALPSESSDGITSLFAKYNPKQAQKISQIVKDTANKYGINPNIIAAIIVHESGVRPCVISKGGDYGLMQVRWNVHRKSYPDVKNAGELLNAETNIRIGTDIFMKYYRQNKTIKAALRKYSGGSSVYAQKILKTVERLEK